MRILSVLRIFETSSCPFKREV